MLFLGDFPMTMIGNIEKYLSYFFVTNIQNVNFIKIFPHISATRNIEILNIIKI